MNKEKSLPNESVLENLGMGLIVASDSLNILFFNQKAEELTGLSRSHVINRSLKEAFHANPWLCQLIEKTLLNCYTLSAYERSLKRPGQKPLPVELTSSPILSKHGSVTGVVTTIKDLSGLKPLREDSLRNERLAFLNTLTAGIVHEVRNPLCGIKGALQLLMRKLDNEALLEYTMVINKEIERIDRILEELLGFSHPRSYTLKPVNIHKVLDHVLNLLSEMANRAGITFVKIYDPSIPQIKGDEDSLIQVFLNIIKNGMEAIEKNGVIEIRTKIIPDFSIGGKDGARKMVSVEIEDNGKGIPKDEIPRIFTPFYTTKEKGTGLGLSLSLKIINEHEGFVDVESMGERGTRFYILLPLPV